MSGWVSSIGFCVCIFGICLTLQNECCSLIAYSSVGLPIASEDVINRPESIREASLNARL